MDQLLQAQYKIVNGARQALFSYCCSMNSADLLKKINSFNNNSIRDLLVHNANTYISWLDNFGLEGILPFYKNDDIKDLNDVKMTYEQIDNLVSDFLKKYSDNYMIPITNHIARRGITVMLTPLQLFTHVITHEFHHKGQILTMSRLLGYIPADTDSIRFEN